MTLSLNQTEGYSTRRHFQLSEEDEAYLNALGLPWETITENQAQRVVIEQFPVPTGYKNNTVTVSVCIPPQYPDVQIDMAFFYPALERSDRQPIRSASVNFPFDGKQWQRWSRHRTKANPWRPGVDCLATHFGLIEEWLKKELRK